MPTQWQGSGSRRCRHSCSRRHGVRRIRHIRNNNSVGAGGCGAGRSSSVSGLSSGVRRQSRHSIVEVLADILIAVAAVSVAVSTAAAAVVVARAVVAV